MTFDADTKIADAANTWQGECLNRVPSDPLAYVSLVNKEEKPVGWLDFADLIAEPDRADAVETCMMRIKAGSVVTADTPLLEAVKLFDVHSPNCYLVIRGTAIVGAFSYQDLLSIPFRSCLFAMLLSIEQGILDVAQTDVDLAASKLNEGTRKRLEGRLKKRLAAGQKVNPSQIIEHASFFEILGILRTCATTERRLTSLSASYTKQRRTFGGASAKAKQEQKLRVELAVELRNALAHANQPWRISHLLPREDLKAFISWLTQFEHQLAEHSAFGNKLED